MLLRVTWPDRRRGTFEDVACIDVTEVWRQQRVKQRRLAGICTAKDKHLTWTKHQLHTLLNNRPGRPIGLVGLL